MPSSPVMNDFWRDVVSIGSAVVTVIGLIYAIRQIWKTQSAAEAARESADRAFAESRSQFQRYALTNALRFVAEVKLHVGSRAWELASIRTSDLAEQVSQLSETEPEWEPIAQDLRKWETEFGRLASGTLKRLRSSARHDFLNALQGKIDKQHGPFKGHDPEGSR